MKTLPLLLLLAVPAQAQQGQEPAPKDAYWAYFVRISVQRQTTYKEGEAVLTTAPIILLEGPVTFGDGLTRSQEIRRDGVCRILTPTLTHPGRATCYPPHRVQLVEVVSPGN